MSNIVCIISNLLILLTILQYPNSTPFTYDTYDYQLPPTQIIQATMITKKLLQSSKKMILPHPQYIKPKHKGYRELLGLDRPKQKIYVQSDNQNDDFLEKLLREQAKEKKKKHQLKKKQSKSRVKQSKQKERDKQKDRKSNRLVIESTELKNENNNVILIEKSSDIINSRQDIDKNQGKKEQDKQQASQNKNLEMNAKKQQQDRSIKRFVENLNLNDNQTKRKIYEKMYNSQSQRQIKSMHRQDKNSNTNNNIVIDQQSSIPYIVNNSLLVPAKSTRTSLGYQLLSYGKNDNKQDPYRSINIRHRLNPQINLVQHEINYNSKFPKFKAHVLSTKKLLAMTDGWQKFHSTEKRIVIRDQLFKNVQQQQRFTQNLKKIKAKKYVKPCLL